MICHPISAHPKEINIVFIPKSSSNTGYWRAVRDGAQAAAATQANINFTWRGPAYINDTEAQIKMLQVYTRAGVDVILIAPVHRGLLAEPMTKAMRLGIKVIVVDSPVEWSNYLQYISTNNYAAGCLAAKRMSVSLGGRGSVVVVRTIEGSGSSEERSRGFTEYIQKYSPNIQIVAKIYAGPTHGTAFRRALALWKEQPQIDGVFTTNGPSSEGMLLALRQAGIAGKKKFVAFDVTSLLLKGLELNEIEGLVLQDPWKIGYIGVRTAMASVANTVHIPKIITLNAHMVTLENYKNPEIDAQISHQLK